MNSRYLAGPTAPLTHNNQQRVSLSGDRKVQSCSQREAAARGYGGEDETSRTPNESNLAMDMLENARGLPCARMQGVSAAAWHYLPTTCFVGQRNPPSSDMRSVALLRMYILCLYWS
jgi:hypothetical protein